eukprot:PhF_6_TR16210/c0_g2_i1/m.25166
MQLAKTRTSTNTKSSIQAPEKNLSAFERAEEENKQLQLAQRARQRQIEKEREEMKYLEITNPAEASKKQLAFMYEDNNKAAEGSSTATTPNTSSQQQPSTAVAPDPNSAAYRAYIEEQRAKHRAADKAKILKADPLAGVASTQSKKTGEVAKRPRE